jgi:uncharacterized protein involved in exopolysaccharide biosynthesis
LSDKNPHNPETPENPKKDQVSEVRYIPVEYLPQMNDEESEIDLIELAKNIWDGRWTIAKITGVFVAIGLFIALFSPVEYESEAILMPEVQQQQDRAGRLLQQFGGAFGLGGGSLQTGQDGTIPPMMYPRIVNSLSFQLELFERDINFADYGVTTTIPDFYENHYSPSLTQWIQRLTIRLPYTVLGWIRGAGTGNTIQVANSFDSEFLIISRKQMDLIKSIRDKISVNLDSNTGLLTTRVTLHDARAAAELNWHLIELLKEYVTDYRVEKVRQDQEFVEEQYLAAKERFESSQLELADHIDRNVTLTTARAQAERERLQDEKDLAFNVYNSLAQQHEQVKLRLQEQTPVFSTIQSVNIPSDKSSPRRGLIVMTSILLGLFIAIIFVLIKTVYLALR